jgi:hypothetical protein
MSFTAGMLWFAVIMAVGSIFLVGLMFWIASKDDGNNNDTQCAQR